MGARMEQELTFEMISAAAQKLKIEPNVLDAVCRLEAREPGFLPSGKSAIRFEGQIFWKEMLKRGFFEDKLRDLSQQYPNVLYPKRMPEFYLEGEREYQRFDDAVTINEGAALAATAWGFFRLMGRQFAECGYDDIHAFVEGQKAGAAGQLEAFCQWMVSRGLIESLQQKDWQMFARLCYGPAYAERKYDKKLERAYKKSLEAHGPG
ncbi:N-acetylmuramidase family protein [Oxalobacter vibrioformis]|uniref:N-acetylmuramidase family protein n=1 Tax=Oxalobacter vibrioformis TaxID=933080 RepID=A0A9E9M0B9_9BURK|nr:N-acetylmuramidase family protein [Oxalobacter vibrioformis]WAW10178.1 N-acetylmuramidase family protein [Oxalobacter vibrioformis]